MRLRTIEMVVVGARMRNRVSSRPPPMIPGVVAWGEATPAWKPHADVGTVEDFQPLVGGKGAFRLGQLWQTMSRQCCKGGIPGVPAVSRIDQALPGVKAQVLGPSTSCWTERSASASAATATSAVGISAPSTPRRIPTSSRTRRSPVSRTVSRLSRCCRCLWTRRRHPTLGWPMRPRRESPSHLLGLMAIEHNLHSAAAPQHWLLQEQREDAAAWSADFVTVPIVIDDRHAWSLSGPGLSVAIDEDETTRHPDRSEPQPRAVHREGAVVDW